MAKSSQLVAGGSIGTGNQLDVGVASVATQKQMDHSKTELLRVDPDGQHVFLRRLSSSGTVAQVEVTSGSTTKVLGSVVQLVDPKTGQVTLRAPCKVHSRCVCWISKATNVDLLFQWLADGRNCTPVEHADLSFELKKSIGMKVKK